MSNLEKAYKNNMINSTTFHLVSLLIFINIWPHLLYFYVYNYISMQFFFLNHLRVKCRYYDSSPFNPRKRWPSHIMIRLLHSRNLLLLHQYYLIYSPHSEFSNYPNTVFYSNFFFIQDQAICLDIISYKVKWAYCGLSNSNTYRKKSTGL